MTNRFLWLFFNKLAALVAVLSVLLGLVFLPAQIPLWYFQLLGLLFVVTTWVSLFQSLRDEKEQQRLFMQLID